MVARELIARGGASRMRGLRRGRRFGDPAEVGARCRKLSLEHERNMRRAEYLAGLRQDVRLAFRHLRRAPAFAMAAVLTLVLAICGYRPHILPPPRATTPAQPSTRSHSAPVPDTSLSTGGRLPR